MFTKKKMSEEQVQQYQNFLEDVDKGMSTSEIFEKHSDILHAPKNSFTELQHSFGEVSLKERSEAIDVFLKEHPGTKVVYSDGDSIFFAVSNEKCVCSTFKKHEVLTGERKESIRVFLEDVKKRKVTEEEIQEYADCGCCTDAFYDLYPSIYDNLYYPLKNPEEIH
mgnify:CR=1 FL=1